MKLIKKVIGIAGQKRHFLMSAALSCFALLGSASIYADNSVRLKTLVITSGNEATDQNYAYIKPVLDEVGVQYDVLNSATQDLTASMLSASPTSTSCTVTDVGCVGNYNGIILTNSNAGNNFSIVEWAALHSYEKNFKVREAVLSGWPEIIWDASVGVYLDYGLANGLAPATPYPAQWTIPATQSKELFEYVNTTNNLMITDFAFVTHPRNDNQVLSDGTIAHATPLLNASNGESLVSVIQYITPGQTIPDRLVMFSSIMNAWYLTHSQVLAYEFINWVTQGVFVGGRGVYMAAHLDDLFLHNEIWNTDTNGTDPNIQFRLTSSDISNAVAKQNLFRSTHPTAGAFKLDFPFNGSGAVVNPLATTLTANLADGLVSAIVANKNEFRFISHTFTHADMDNPVPATTPCDYETLPTVNAITLEINKNRTVWNLLNLPERAQNNRVLVTGNHSGLKDRKCTDIPEQHPEMVNVQDDDVPFEAGANTLFFTAAANRGIDYLASDSSQLNQNVEKYITSVNDGSSLDRLILPRYPANVFFNVTTPEELVDEYNYIFFTLLGGTPGGITAPRDYDQILDAEAETALRHMLSYKKWPHFFHQTNLAVYPHATETGKTLQFDWLNAVYTEYEKLFKLPVKNLPYYLIGDMTKEKLTAKSAIINAVWNRTTNQVSLSANRSVPNLLVTGLQGGDLYGGQLIRQININTTPKVINVNQALNQ